MMKRLMDIIISLIAILILSPLFLVISVGVFLFIGRPIFFLQDRPGLDTKVFKLIKFRSMTDEKNKEEKLLSDEDRITKFGFKLRSSSLDELPELINVLFGEMSLVGPRPLLVEYLDLYNNFQSRRHTVKPGMTGWAQINGRNNLNWEDKFRLDVWYVENMSMILDIKILLLTIIKVLNKEGVSQGSLVGAPVFKGTKDDIK